MPRLTRPELIDLCENRYFGNVVRERLDAVLACFTPDTVVVIRHGDNPERRFFGRPEGEALHVSEFWKHLQRQLRRELRRLRARGRHRAAAHRLDVPRDAGAQARLALRGPGHAAARRTVISSGLKTG